MSQKWLVFGMIFLRHFYDTFCDTKTEKSVAKTQVSRLQHVDAIDISGKYVEISNIFRHNPMDVTYNQLVTPASPQTAKAPSHTHDDGRKSSRSCGRHR